MTSDKIAPDSALELIAVELATHTEWTGNLGNRIAEIVTKAGYAIVAPPAAPAPEAPTELKCPKCGQKDPERFELRESYTAYHPIEGFKNGLFVVTNALATTCPSEHFDEGEEDFAIICKECAHSDEPERFGAPDSSEWTWE